MRSCTLLACALGLAVAGCASPPPVAEAPPPAGQTGIATWYGARHEGRPMANGEIFDKEAMTAAHRTLPLGTQVKVTNLGTGRSVQVRITDRCVCRNSIIDLSQSAAATIGIPTQGGGTGQVRVEEL